MNYAKKHLNLFISIFIVLFCVVLYCFNLGEFPFIDYDESKYVLIARDMLASNDWLNLKLNGNNFFDCPPLLFWLINISFLVFGKISSFAARVPSVIFCILGILTLYLTVSKILTKLYAVIISAILSTCFGFLVFGHLATNDILYTFSVMISILCAYQIILIKLNENNIFLWLTIYIFTGFSILCGGLFGILPIIIIIVMHIFAGKLKNIFRAKNIGLFTAVMLILVLPWFLIMVKNNNLQFIKEFISGYNFIKYAGIKNYLYNILLFVIGFMPWTFAFLWIIGTRFRDICVSVLSYIKDDSQDKLSEKWRKLSKVDKFLSLNTIVFFTTLIFAVLYGAKYTYLILLMMFPAACISGHYWYEYMYRNKRDRSIFFATIFPNILFIMCAIAILLGHKYIDSLAIYGAIILVVPLVVIFFVMPLISIFAVILKGRIPAFISNVVLMLCLSFVLTPSGYNFIVVNSGESDLIEFARIANHDGVKLSTFLASNKYSLVYYYENMVDFHSNKDIEWLDDYLKSNEEDYIVTEIKDLWHIEDKQIKYMLLDSGKRYCMIKHLPRVIEQKIEEEGEPEVIIQ